MMFNACHQEIVYLHRFFEDWFAGRLEPTERALARLSEVLAPGFALIGPDGASRAREEVIASVRSAHANRPGPETALSIRIEHPTSHSETEGHDLPDFSRGRQSSALFSIQGWDAVLSGVATPPRNLVAPG